MPPILKNNCFCLKSLILFKYKMGKSWITPFFVYSSINKVGVISIYTYQWYTHLTKNDYIYQNNFLKSFFNTISLGQPYCTLVWTIFFFNHNILCTVVRYWKFFDCLFYTMTIFLDTLQDQVDISDLARLVYDDISVLGCLWRLWLLDSFVFVTQLLHRSFLESKYIFAKMILG